jgi:hypothetical protein
MVMSTDQQARNFDLNIEKILEGWEICHAVREIIANALDEQALSKTRDIWIEQDRDSSWHIRDFGRGLKYEHLTQNENQEKLKNPANVIGKFGVGLKDALATLNRQGKGVLIRSKYGDITLGTMPKHGFSDVVTLHAVVRPPQDAAFAGTDVVLRGLSIGDINRAKDFFLKFSNESVLDEIPHGQILGKDPKRKARIYVTGMLVAEEENFAFSYNITSLTATMRKALNRERTNVGRTAYADRVKQMLLASTAAAVADTLASDLVKIEAGTNHDEVKWMDVAVHACQILNAAKGAIFVTASDLVLHKAAVDHAQADGLKIVTVPENVRHSLQGVLDLKGNPVRDLSVYQTEWENSFKFKFVRPESLSKAESEIFRRTQEIAKLVDGLPKRVREIKISETMRPDFLSGSMTKGLWDPGSASIIILRSELKSLRAFAGTLLHEIAHAKSGYDDVTRDFENELTNMLGIVAAVNLE